MFNRLQNLGKFFSNGMNTQTHLFETCVDFKQLGNYQLGILASRLWRLPKR